jgi:hypothetical protein
VRNEFSLAFIPPAHDGAIHSLEVRVTAEPGQPAGQIAGQIGVLSSYRVDCRHAYLAPSPTTH